MQAAIEALKCKLAVAAVKRHGTLEGAAKELGLTVPGVRNLLKRHGYRCNVQVIKKIELRKA